MLSQNLVKEVGILFETRQRELYVAALAITRERDSAEDAVHDALLAIVTLEVAPTDLEAYLFRTVRNKALHGMKRDQRIDRTLDPVDFLNTEGCPVEQKQLATKVLKYLDVLEEHPRQVIVMKLFADLTFNEISKIMDSSPNTVASWYRRGLSKMKEQFYEL